MRVRFIRPWRNYRVGQELENFHDGMATTLIRRGIVVSIEIEDDRPKKRRKEIMIPPIARHA